MEIQASDWPFVLLLVPLVSRQNGAFKLQNNFKYQELRYVGNGAGHISLAEERNHRGAERSPLLAAGLRFSHNERATLRGRRRISAIWICVTFVTCRIGAAAHQGRGEFRAPGANLFALAA